MNLLASLMVTQSLFQALQAPVLEFPESGVDDPAAYEGYVTRFFRDASGNTFQIYLREGGGRVVHVWADAANESAAFTARDTLGRPAVVVWGGTGVTAESDGRRRIMHHRLAVHEGAIDVGWFVLGTMRQERDFQHVGWHHRAWDDEPFVLQELTDLVEALERLPEAERTQHLELLRAADAAELRSRLEPRVRLSHHEAGWRVSVEHTSLDGRNRVTLALEGKVGSSSAALTERTVAVRALGAEPIVLDVTVTTDADALTPLGRTRLFNQAFEDYYRRRRLDVDSVRETLTAAEAARDPRMVAFRRLERQVLGLELLSSEEKLMASMPNYATYFGRDQMMSALMLEPISSIDVQELVIGSVLGKLGPAGDVSHEEALGGQAIREHAAAYARLIEEWESARDADPAAAAERLARAGALLGDVQAVRENYHMIDDDFQLPVLAARYLTRADVPAARKRAFLEAPGPAGTPRVDALMLNLALVARLAAPYAEQPTRANLVEFPRRDARGWLPGSWRDSRVGYANGRYAMDVNVVWVPKALEAMRGILEAVDAIGLSVPDAVSRIPTDASVLRALIADPGALASAIERWRGARRHFEVRLDAEAIQAGVHGWLDSLSAPERDYWRTRLEDGAPADGALPFLALALDSVGQPIPAVNTDPATAVFLEDYTEQVLRGTTDPAAVLRVLDAMLRPYPVGLFVEGLGPLVVNDAYAGEAVQRRFREDPYHSPRVVWGREVNLLLLGLAHRIHAAYDDEGRLRADGEALDRYVRVLRRALEGIERAVDASGLSHNELWSYRIEGGALRPVRYGVSSDIQLWNVTDLAVRFLVDQLPAR